MQIARSIAAIREALAPHRQAGAAIGFVPTMGAFHSGHVALFDAARRECGVVVVSLFVNPAQFGDPADLAKYPRNEARDAQMAQASGVDYLFAPGAADIYAAGHATWVEPSRAATTSVRIPFSSDTATYSTWSPCSLPCAAATGSSP